MSEYWQNDNRSWSTDSLRYINMPAKQTQELFYFIQEIGHFKTYKPYFTERENLPSYLVVYTYNGEGTLYYNGQTYKLKQGDVFFIDCMNYQHYFTSSNEPWEMDWVHFYGSNTKKFYDYFMDNESNVFASTNIRISQIMTRLLDHQSDKNVKTDFEISLLLHELLNELIIQKNNIGYQKNEQIPNYLVEMRAFLDANVKENISLNQLELIYSINKYQLNKEFSRYMGMPPIEYHITNKMSYAKELLLYSNRSIKSVATEVGINNFPYFSKLFKKK